jgi:hypothetical protein
MINSSDLCLLAMVGVGLLVVDRIYRINPYKEQFSNPTRCGVDMPPCSFPNKCANGFCVSENTPPLPPNGLRVYP